MSLYGYLWSGGGWGLLCSGDGWRKRRTCFLDQDAASGPRQHWWGSVWCQWEAGLRTLFCKGWSWEGVCVLERTLKLRHLQWGRWWGWKNPALWRWDWYEGIKINCWTWLLTVSPQAALVSLATQAHPIVYHLMNQNYQILAIASLLKEIIFIFFRLNSQALLWISRIGVDWIFVIACNLIEGTFY